MPRAHCTWMCGGHQARAFSNRLVAEPVTAITKPGKHPDGNDLHLLVKLSRNRSWAPFRIGRVNAGRWGGHAGSCVARRTQAGGERKGSFRPWS